jgi:hypothetical protein
MKNHSPAPMNLFKKLSTSDEKNFRHWARINYTPFSSISGVWHPVVQDECRKMNEESGMVQGLRVLGDIEKDKEFA